MAAVTGEIQVAQIGGEGVAPEPRLRDAAMEGSRFVIVEEGDKMEIKLDYSVKKDVRAEIDAFSPPGYKFTYGCKPGPKDHPALHTLRGGGRRTVAKYHGASGKPVDIEYGGNPRVIYAGHTTLPDSSDDIIARLTDEGVSVCKCRFPHVCSKCDGVKGGSTSSIDVLYYLDKVRFTTRLAMFRETHAGFVWLTRNVWPRGEMLVVPWANGEGATYTAAGNAHSYDHEHLDWLVLGESEMVTPFGPLTVVVKPLAGYVTKNFMAFTMVAYPKVMNDPPRILPEVSALSKVLTYSPSSIVPALLQSKVAGDDGNVQRRVAEAYVQAYNVADAHLLARRGLSARQRMVMDNYELHRKGVTRRIELSMWQEFVCYAYDAWDSACWSIPATWSRVADCGLVSGVGMIAALCASVFWERMALSVWLLFIAAFAAPLVCILLEMRIQRRS